MTTEKKLRETELPLAIEVEGWISWYDSINYTNPYEFSNFIYTIEDKVRKAIQLLEVGEILAIYQEQALLERLKTIGQIPYLPPLPLDHAESGIQISRGISYCIIDEETLEKFLRLAGYDMENYSPPKPYQEPNV